MLHFIRSEVFSLPVNSFNIHGLASLWMCHWMGRPHRMVGVFFPHFSCLAWICHMQADRLHHCLKRGVTDRPIDSMSFDVTFLSGSSIILLHRQETGYSVQADLSKSEGIYLWRCWVQLIFGAKNMSNVLQLDSFQLDSFTSELVIVPTEVLSKM